MRFLLPVLFLVTFGSSAFASGKTDSLLDVLKTEIARKKIYDGQKERRIKNLKTQLSGLSKTDYKRQYEICGKLYDEYKVFQFDSAYAYTQKLLLIGATTHDVSMQYNSRVKLAFILLSSGMFKETFDCLNKINARLLSDSCKLEYYALNARAYSDLSDYNNDMYYTASDNAESLKYLDSSISLARPNSYEMLRSLGDKQIRTGQIQQPSPFYSKLLLHFALTEHQRAMTATALSNFYAGPYQTADREQLLTIGAINDIRSSTKETLAIFLLSQQLYNDGNINDAYVFINQAMDDAQYYGARLRKLKIGAVLPFIAAQQIIATEKEKDRFLVYLLSIAGVAILFTLISFIVFIQLKRLRVKEKIIEEKNVQLEKINEKLIEDTHIKEEYIGYFFNVISGYILKLEKLKRSVERKLSIKKYEDILVSVNEINIKKERETLFYTFDHVFLKIFPNFINTFNSLFKKEDQIWPKDHEVLNTDLRIFALMRLGINDNETIAAILEYSVNTIYVYKMRIKAKDQVPSDQFYHHIMDIKAVDVVSKSSE